MEIHLKIKDVVGQDEKGRHIFLVNNEDLRDCILERKDWVLQEIVKEHLLKQPKAIAMILDDNDIRNTIYMQEKARREEKSEKRERHHQFEIEKRRRQEAHKASIATRKALNMEKEIEFYRTLIKKMRVFLTKHYSEPDITIITCLIDAYHSSMECAYSEYNKTSFISKWRWKKRLREQIRNIQQFYIRYIVFAL